MTLSPNTALMACTLWFLAGAAKPEARAASDWPVFRHGLRLSGVSPAVGKIIEPEIRWEYYLGAAELATATHRVAEPTDTADLDGDGQVERFAVEGKTLRVTDLGGRLLWSYTVDGHPLGGNVRVARLFPGAKDQQILSFSSRMDTGEGQGYCFRFDQGAARGRLAWTTGPLTGQHSPTLVIDDVDGDGLPEIVTAPHYRVQIFSGQTGQLKAEVPWDVGRNYGILLTRPRGDRPQKDIFIVCDFVLHVDCTRLQDGKWVHAWGQKYFEPNSPVPKGREKYIRVGPRPIADLDGDGKDEMVYMLVDAGTDDQWHLRVRDCETGGVKADVPGVWLWSVASLRGDGKTQLLYTPTARKRPPRYCDLHVATLASGKLADVAVLRRVQPLLTSADLPPTAHTIADEGQLDLLQADLDQDGLPEIFYGLKSEQGNFTDRLRADSLAADGRLNNKWRYDRPPFPGARRGSPDPAAAGHRLNLVHAGPAGSAAPVVWVRDLSDGHLRTIDARGSVIAEEDLGRPGGFATTPIAVDLDGDGLSEIVVQNAAEEILALRPGKARTDPPQVLWSVPGVAMNPSPGYTRNGPLCPQAADLDGDGRPEVVLATEDADGLAAVTCVDASGKTRWTRSIEGCPAGGLQAGVNLWTFGRFAGRERGLDVYVDIHRRSKGSSEGWTLRGDTGEVLWRKQGLVAQETAMPFGGGLPAVADINGDGYDDLIQEFWTVYGVISGRTGEPIFPPAFLWGPKHFGKWIAYSSPTVADLDGDGRLEAYLNSASNTCGGFAAVRIDGKPLWAEFRDNLGGPCGFGPVGDFDRDGALEIAVPVVSGTLVCLRAKDGKVKWSTKTPVASDAVAADINGDGILEILFSGSDGRLHALGGKDGREVWSIPATGRPVVADVDGDGAAEVLAVGADGVLRVVGAKKGLQSAR